MIDAIFLNPLTKSQLKAGGRKHNVKSNKLKGWQSMVKKHGGDLKAAAREWKKTSTSKSGSRSKRGASASRSSASRKGLSGLAARRAASNSKGVKGGVPMAARKKTRRRRNSAPPEPKWVADWRRGMTAYLGKTPRGPKFKKISSKGTSQWKSKTKRALRSTMRKHAKKSPRAKSFAAAVQRGIRMSKELNPMSPETWARRFALATGYAPYRKRTKTGRKTKRRRGPTPGTAAWAKKVVKGVKGGGRRKYRRRTSTQESAKKYEKGLIAAMKREFPSLKRAMNPRKRRKSKRRKGRRMNRYPMISARALVPYKKQKKSKRRRNKGTYRRNRMKNPVADSLRSMISTEALTKYAYATGGVAVGGVFPALVSRFIWKGAQRSQMTESLVGLGGTILAGITVNYATKDQQKGMLVVAGGLAGVVGNILVNQLSKVMGISGFGQSAEDALKMAVEQEMERAGLSGGGMGQFLVPGEAEQVEGLGQFLTEPEMESAVATTQGMGDIAREDLVDSGSAAFAGIDGSMF